MLKTTGNPNHARLGLLHTNCSRLLIWTFSVREDDGALLQILLLCCLKCVYMHTGDSH